MVTEPFIVPALYEKYHNTSDPPVDEWTLTQAMAKANALSDLENHYATFITERDFADIAAAGLNFVRIPLPWWAIEVRGNEPFIPNKSWTYFLKAIQWARKYGIRINLDLVCEQPFLASSYSFFAAFRSGFTEWMESLWATWRDQFSIWGRRYFQRSKSSRIRSCPGRVHFSASVPGRRRDLRYTE